jgi:dTDP-4-amino-4,6-dideoxygalactose transaminase
MASAESFPELPLFDLQLQPQDFEAVAETLRSGWLTMGPRTAAF